ncbi:MAG: hypothetical protein AAB250_08550, partial [Bdellovibrionota bacterium]
VHFSSESDFSSTKFAQLGINHPILLALRYIRLLAMNYHRSHRSTGYPDEAALLHSIDRASGIEVMRVIEKAIHDPGFGRMLENEKFKGWMNGTIQKAFRSYTNPTAAKILMVHFKADLLIGNHTDQLESINQYLFREPRDENAIAEKRKKWGFDERALTPRATYFPDGRLYHGTRSEESFRSILFQGVLKSTSGLGGEGLYGVGKPFLQFAIDWTQVGPDLVVSFEIDRRAVLVDTTQGRGKEIFEAYAKATGSKGIEAYDSFARELGIDILRYDYGETVAFVVKNGEILEKANGLTRKLMPIGEMIEVVRKSRDMSGIELFKMIAHNGLNETEIELLRKLPNVQVALRDFRTMNYVAFLEAVPWFARQIEMSEGKSFTAFPEAKQMLERFVMGDDPKRTTAMEGLERAEKILKETDLLKRVNYAIFASVGKFAGTLGARAVAEAKLHLDTPENRIRRANELHAKIDAMHPDVYEADEAAEKALDPILKKAVQEIVAKAALDREPPRVALKRAAALADSGGTNTVSRSHFVAALKPMMEKFVRQVFIEEGLEAKGLAEIVKYGRASEGRTYFENNVINANLAPLVARAAKETIARIPMLDRPELLDPKSDISSLVFVARDASMFGDAKMPAREAFVKAIPKIVKAMSDAELAELFLEAERKKSFLGWYAAYYEIHRRAGAIKAVESLTFDIKNWSEFANRSFTEGIHDSVLNMQTDVEFSLEMYKRWILQGTAPGLDTVLERMWKKFGFDQARDADFAKSLVSNEAGMKMLSGAMSKLVDSNIKVNDVWVRFLPKARGAVDAVFAEYLAKSKATGGPGK